MAGISLDLMMPFVTATETVASVPLGPLQRTQIRTGNNLAFSGIHQTVVIGIAGSIQGCFVLQLPSDIPAAVPLGQAIVSQAQQQLSATRYRFETTSPILLSEHVATLCQGGGGNQSVQFQSPHGNCSIALHLL